jgi:2,4-dichlorophenol 6-monooxygenase
VDPVRDYLPSGRPGGRMPQAWLMRDGKRISTLDLLELDSFTLLTTSHNDAWAAAASAVSDVPLRYVALDPEQLSDEARWVEESGIGSDGALLIRPDQHVAWRAPSLPKDTSSVLREVIAQIVGGLTS